MANLDFSGVKGIAIPEGDVIKIDVSGTVIWKRGYTNWVPLSTNADGTIYNNGLGYKDGYRVRSGGAEAANTAATCTGFIPFTTNNVMRISPAFTGENATNAVNFYDASHTNLGQINSSGAAYGICGTYVDAYKAAINNTVNGIAVINISDIPNAGDVAYVRVTNGIVYGIISSGAQMIITIDEEITD